MQRLRGIRVLALVMALAMITTACGGSDSEDTTTTAAAASGGGDDGGDGGDDTTTTTTAPTTTTTEVSVSGDGDSDWCRELRRVSEETEGPGDIDILTATPEELGRAFETVLDAFSEAADSAPSEIADDVDVLVNAYATFVEKGKEANWNLLALANDPDFAATFDDPAIEQAGDRIDAYGRDVCGVDFSTLADTSGAPPGPGGGDGSDDDPVSIVLSTIGIPRALFTDEQIECVTEELGEEFVASVTPGWVATPAAIEALLAAVDACEIELG